MTRLLVIFGILLTALAPLVSAREERDRSGIEFFETRIRPMLNRYCYECHSAKATKVRGGLLLDTREVLRKGGDTGLVVVPGKPSEISLFQALEHQNLKMPPKSKLHENMIADFAHWVKIGAPDPRTQTVHATPSTGELWSLRPINKPAIPTVKEPSWPRSAVDSFVLARLERQGWRPGGDAEPHTLLRRLHYVVTGLPPTPEQVERFESSALDWVVDELLASRHFGERWARHWLDLARYTDVSGSTAPAAYPEAWRYREYVIDAFNSDKPFDRFTREQLAGDLLPASNPEEKAANLIATGYLGLFHLVAADRDPDKRKLDVIDEQFDVLGKNFLGISLGCARCHDHKLDPVPTRDYYALAGIFRSTANVTGGFGTSGSMSVSLGKFPPNGPVWMRGDKVKVITVADEKEQRNETLRIRGDVENQGDLIPRTFPTMVKRKDLPKIPPGQSGRIQLEDWLLHDDNPLVARVIVNRVWHHLFGQGFVRSTDNFGTTGDQGFVVVSPPAGSTVNCVSDFLSAVHQATLLRDTGKSDGEKIRYFSDPRLSPELRGKQLEFLREVNREHAEKSGKDSRLDSMIDSMELAFRMEQGAPQVLDVTRETAETQALYGINEPQTDAFGRQCLLARRLAEAGVRFIQVTSKGWDHHGSMYSSLKKSCARVDRPIGGLLADLK